MRKVLLWGVGVDFSRYLNLIRYFEIKDDIQVVGVTANETIYEAIYGYVFYPKEKLSGLEFDMVIVMSDLAFQEIEKEIKSRGIEVPIIPCNVLSIPGFDMERYIRIKKNVPTIFACNCWGGLLYHRLKFPFLSPFINLYVEDEDFLRFLNMPRSYMDKEIEYHRADYDEYLGKEYPVGMCGDIEMHFNHYKDFSQAKENWERRKKRIHWDNIFVMMYTEKKSVAELFSQLPYKKKICFVPFESNLSGICPIPYIEKKDIPFFEIVNGIVSGRYHYYDIMSILSGEVARNSILH